MTLFEFLFKYRLLLFQEGEVAFTSPWPMLGLALGTGLIAFAALLTYGVARGKTRPLDRWVMAGLRLGALALVVFSLAQPTLVLTSVVPQRNFLGIVIDDSRSMEIADLGGAPRSAFVQETFGPESQLIEELGEKFTLRFFRFSDVLERIDDLSEMSFAGTRSSLGPALVQAYNELSGVPLSGLVVLTDGADNSNTSLRESVLPLQAAGVPVFPVGLGRELLDPDIQVSRIELPRRVLRGTSLVVEVVVAQSGFQGRTVPLEVSDGSRILASTEVELPRNGEATVVRVRFTAEEAGARALRFHIPPQEGERVVENNTREVLMRVEDRREKILYFEGEPRFEVKFLRRAVADDENLQLVVLQRTADDKYLRLDVDDPEELFGGFPKTREQLFQYRAIVLGSAQASLFTHDQLEMIADFVSQRGGGLLVLGSPHSFAEGGFSGTPVAEVLPVVMADGPATSPTLVDIRVRPTRAGRTHPATQIAPSEEASLQRWAELPAVSSVNPIFDTKPGATTLLSGTPEDGSPERVVLAWHRYGRGKAIAMPIQDSWIWQMHADIPLEDLTHETFWRQTLRWLVDGVPDQVSGESAEDLVEPGSTVQVQARIADRRHLEVNDAAVQGTVVAPDGSETPITLEWTVEEDGVYGGSFETSIPGIYEVRFSASREGEALGDDVVYLRAASSDREYFDAGMRESALKRLAEETGGIFYTPETVGSMAEDIQFTGAGVTVTEERDLWDMPIILLLLLGLVSAEWAYRRARGLV